MTVLGNTNPSKFLNTSGKFSYFLQCVSQTVENYQNLMKVKHNDEKKKVSFW